MTNYELIKNMSIEEMAVTIMCPNELGMAEIECDKSDSDINCRVCCYEWLRMDPDGQLSPPEIVDLHQNGTLCEKCGAVIGEPVGEPRYCAGCED